MPRYTNRDLPHKWVHRKDFNAEGTGSNFYFQGPWIFSYGRHFPLALDAGVEAFRLIIATDGAYSNSTSRHQSYLRRAIIHVTTIHVPELVWPRKVEGIVEDLVSYLRERLKDLNDIKGNKPRQLVSIHDDITYYSEQALELIGHMDNGAVNPDLRDYLNKTRPTSDSRAEVTRILAEVRSGKLAERYQRCVGQLERQSQRMQGKAPGQVEMTDEVIAEWLAGERRSLDGHRSQRGHDLMRINGEIIETSQGVRVPRNDVERAWPRIKFCYNALEATGYRDEIDFSRHADRVKFGSFRADRLTDSGMLVVGCHQFTQETIFNLARELGLS